MTAGLLKLSPTRPSAVMVVEVLAVEGVDAGRLLAAVLEGVQAERRVGGRLGVAEDREHAALLVRLVVVEGCRCPHPLLLLELRLRRRRTGHGLALGLGTAAVGGRRLAGVGGTGRLRDLVEHPHALRQTPGQRAAPFCTCGSVRASRSQTGWRPGGTKAETTR